MVCLVSISRDERLLDSTLLTGQRCDGLLPYRVSTWLGCSSFSILIHGAVRLLYGFNGKHLLERICSTCCCNGVTRGDSRGSRVVQSMKVVLIISLFMAVMVSGWTNISRKSLTACRGILLFSIIDITLAKVVAFEKILG